MTQGVWVFDLAVIITISGYWATILVEIKMEVEEPKATEYPLQVRAVPVKIDHKAQDITS